MILNRNFETVLKFFREMKDGWSSPSCSILHVTLYNINGGPKPWITYTCLKGPIPRYPTWPNFGHMEPTVCDLHIKHHCLRGRAFLPFLTCFEWWVRELKQLVTGLVLSQWIGNDIEKTGIPTLKPFKKTKKIMIEKKFQTFAKEKGPS